MKFKATERDCGSCPFFRNEDASGFGWCSLRDEGSFCGNDCLFFLNKKMTIKQTLKVLHEHQKWRRGGKNKMLPPFLIGDAIDNAIRLLRCIKKIRGK